VPPPLGPYRDSPATPERVPTAIRWRWIALAAAALTLVAFAVIAPWPTAVFIVALGLYIGAPWFIAQAPGD